MFFLLVCSVSFHHFILCLCKSHRSCTERHMPQFMVLRTVRMPPKLYTHTHAPGAREIQDLLPLHQTIWQQLDNSVGFSIAEVGQITALSVHTGKASLQQPSIIFKTPPRENLHCQSCAFNHKPSKHPGYSLAHAERFNWTLPSFQN